MTEKTIARARELYALICNGYLGDDAESVQLRVAIIKELENTFNTVFKDTWDFFNKMENFLSATNLGSALREEREQLGWTQARLAAVLGVSQSLVAQMENGTKPLINKALEFLAKKGRNVPRVPHAQPDFGNKNAIDNKEDTGGKNGGHGPAVAGSGK